MRVTVIYISENERKINWAAVSVPKPEEVRIVDLKRRQRCGEVHR